ncbi:MAG: TlpA family protein disulfide reductase [Flavobacteriales bacterium]|nr:TlpA family protein disulfide reductase [Flavobacteriales bacterium]
MRARIVTHFLLACGLGLLGSELFAQKISGSIVGLGPGKEFLVLRESRGSLSRPVDSVMVGSQGQFVFSDRFYPLGFYELALNDSDRVDVILDPRERAVQLDFSGVPLQRHIRVLRSEENKLLWDYKLVSKESQAVQASVMAEKRSLEANDTKRMLELDSVSARAITLQKAHLIGIIEGHPKSYFAKVLRADRGLDAARDEAPNVLLRIFDFGDASLMRSSSYDKAVMTYLRNLHAVSEEQFVSTTDTLLLYAGRDPECKAYMLDHLIDLFSAYGPEMPLRHLIDHYVTSPEGLQHIDPSLQSKVQELLKVSVGTVAPDVDLPGTEGLLSLRGIVEKNRFTALFFYSSTCEHCHQQMPLAKEAYGSFKPKGFDMIGIALDADTTEFQKMILEKGLPWKCFSEFNGWGSKVAKAFQVHATPSFFLLDKQMRIVAKPVDAIELRNFLEVRSN